jgi:hypothetical protein
MTVVSADDFCVSTDTFAVLMDLLQSDDTVAYAYAAHGHYDSSSNLRYLRRPHVDSYIREGAEEFQDLAFDCYVLHSGTIIRRDAYDSAGGYDPSTRYAVDYKMWLLLCSRGKVAYSPEQLYGYRVHTTSMSRSRSSVRPSLLEMLDGIRSACSIFGGRYAVGSDFYDSVVRNALVAIPTDDIFSGRTRQGWLAYWEAVKLHPIPTLFQRRTAALLLRTCLGHNLFHRAWNHYRLLTSSGSRTSQVPRVQSRAGSG